MGNLGFYHFMANTSHCTNFAIEELGWHLELPIKP